MQHNQNEILTERKHCFICFIILEMLSISFEFQWYFGHFLKSKKIYVCMVCLHKSFILKLNGFRFTLLRIVPCELNCDNNCTSSSSGGNNSITDINQELLWFSNWKVVNKISFRQNFPQQVLFLVYLLHWFIVHCRWIVVQSELVRILLKLYLKC